MTRGFRDGALTNKIFENLSKEEPRSVHELMHRTGLTNRQVRNGIMRLNEMGIRVITILNQGFMLSADAQLPLSPTHSTGSQPLPEGTAEIGSQTLENVLAKVFEKLAADRNLISELIRRAHAT